MGRSLKVQFPDGIKVVPAFWRGLRMRLEPVPMSGWVFHEVTGLEVDWVAEEISHGDQ